jgi:hypothetical protein
VSRAKAGVALVLAVSLALPVATVQSCTATVGADLAVHTVYGPKENRYAWSGEGSLGTRAIAVLPFVWPILLLGTAAITDRRRLKRLLWCLEPLAAALACLVVWMSVGMFARPAAGAYRAYLGNGLLAGLWLFELGRSIRERRRVT